MADLSYDVNLGEAKGLDKIVAGLGVAGGAVQKLNVSVKVLGGEMDTASDKAKHLDSSFKGIGQTVENAKHGLSNFFDFVGASLAADAIKAIGHEIINLGKEAINAAAGAERVGLSFEFVLGAEGAKDMLGWIEKIAGSTEFTDDSLKNWTLQLANAGLKGENLKDNLAAVLDVAAKHGPQAAEAAVDALSRATLSGKIEGRALRGLGIPVADLAQLDQFKGLNEKQINKKLETATIKKDDLLQLIAGPDKLLGDFAVRASETMSAKLTHLRDLPDQFFQKFADSPAYDVMRSRLGTLLEELDPESDKGKQIFGALESVFTTIVDQIEKIDFKAVADTIVNDVIPVVVKLVGLIGPAVEGVAQVARGFGVMGDVVSQIGRGFGVMGDAAARVDRGLGAMADAVGLRGAGSDSSKTVAAGVGGSLGVVAAAGAGIGQALMDGLDAKIERHSPPRVFLRVGQDIPRAVALGIESEQASLDEAVSGMVSLPAPDATGAPAGGATSMTIGDIIIHVGDGVDPVAGRAAGEAAADAFEARMQAFFERKALEQRT